MMVMILSVVVVRFVTQYDFVSRILAEVYSQNPVQTDGETFWDHSVFVACLLSVWLVVTAQVGRRVTVKQKVHSKSRNS